MSAQPSGANDVDGNSKSQVARERWIKSYGHQRLQGQFFRVKVEEGQPHSDILPIKLVVTTAENDEASDNNERLPGVFGSKGVSYGVEIAEDWRIHHFYHSSRGTKGGGGVAIPESDRKRLDELIANLPQDAVALPPVGRRLLVQVAHGDHYLSHVYDRANAPVEVLEILRLSHSGIRSVVSEIKPETEWQVYRYGDAVFSVCPDGETLLVGEPGWPFRFSFWNSKTKEQIRKDSYWPMNTMAREALFSPDNKHVALFDRNDCTIVEVTTGSWKLTACLDEPNDGRDSGWREMAPPSFTSDGKFLVLHSVRPAIRVFETTTWKQVDPPSYFPAGVLGYFPARKSRRAVIGTQRGTVALWDADQSREYATLDENADIRHVAFSPDESLVAAVLTSKRKSRIGLWAMATGKLIHELYPLEQITGLAQHLVWTNDGKYLLAATKADSFFTSMNLSVWNAKTGRHRGDLTGPPSRVLGIGWLNGEKQIAAGGHDGKVRIWNFEAARQQIEEFERSLESTAAP